MMKWNRFGVMEFKPKIPLKSFLTGKRMDEDGLVTMWVMKLGDPQNARKFQIGRFINSFVVDDFKNRISEPLQMVRITDFSKIVEMLKS